jgi:protoheme IX farnesyltransferase
MEQVLIYNPALSDYWHLLKPRVMSLVVFTGFCGLFLAPSKIHPIIGFTAILSLAIGAGASGCLNMWWEKDTDALMKRTATRALPAGRIDPDSALALGVILSCGSVFTMLVAVNVVAAFWLAFSIFFYVIVYTIILKPRTPQNIVIGGVAGALPPVIGWASVMNSTSIEAWSLFLIIFLWTPAHFWALALHYVDDYKRADIPMLPCLKGERKTKSQIFLYTALTVLSSYLPYYLGMVGSLYLFLATGLGIGFVVLSVAVYFSRYSSFSLFSYSILYLFLIFLNLLVNYR